jgi:nitrogen regulatory protein PII
MIRLEIIANNSILEDLLESLARKGLDSHYTIVPVVHGRGDSAQKRGDAIWPEENFIMIIWCDKDKADGIDAVIAATKKKFPDEGIKIFRLAGEG